MAAMDAAKGKVSALRTRMEAAEIERGVAQTRLTTIMTANEKLKELVDENEQFFELPPEPGLYGAMVNARVLGESDRDGPGDLEVQPRESGAQRECSAGRRVDDGVQWRSSPASLAGGRRTGIGLEGAEAPRAVKSLGMSDQIWQT
jgi:hypothetical protein